MADVVLSITIPNQFVARVVAAINARAGKEMSIQVLAAENVPFQFQYAPKAAEETQMQYGQRFVKEYIRAFVRCHELNTDATRFSSAVAAVPVPSQSVPDEIVV